MIAFYGENMKKNNERIGNVERRFFDKTNSERLQFLLHFLKSNSIEYMATCNYEGKIQIFWYKNQ